LSQERSGGVVKLSVPVRKALAPIRHAPFGRLLTCYTVNQVGDFVGLVALALLVYGETQDPLATSALFVCAQFVPSLFAPLLTARLDQFPPRRVLPAMFAVEGLLFAALALVATQAFSLWAVLLLAFVDGTLMLTARGIVRGAINEVLEPAGLLREGNALVNLGFAFATVGGSAVGGLLVGVFGAGTALAIDAASFAAVALLLATAKPFGTHHEDHEPLRERLKGGFAFVVRDPRVRLLIGGETLAVLVFTIVVPVEVVYAKETLGTDDAGYGILLAAWGAGAVLGSLLFVRFARRSTALLIALSTFAIGAAYIGMGTSRTLLVACSFSVLGGIGNGLQWVSVMTAVQEATPARLQARIAGLLESTTAGVTGIGFLVGGVLTAVTSPDIAFLAAGAATIALALVGSALATRIRPYEAAAASR
jgi:MFS family permease